MMTDQVYTRALVMVGEPDERQQEMLRILCEAGAASLAARLVDGLTPEDCQEEFVTAAAMLAAAGMAGFEEAAEFKAGDLTVKMKDRKEGTAAELRFQADQLMGPYLKARFLFAGV